MTSKTLFISYKDSTNEIELDTSKITTYDVLFEKIKSLFNLKEGDFDLYLEPSKTFLKKDN